MKQPVRDVRRITRRRFTVGKKISITLKEFQRGIPIQYLLRELNGIPAHMVFIYFIGDRDMDGPMTPGE